MFCDICQKNEATVHYTEIVHNQMIKMDLCEECAKAKGVGVQSPFSISDLLSGLAEINMDPSRYQDPVCKLCGLSFNNFRKSGRLGCSECYDTFKTPLESLIKTLHKSTQHYGKKYRDTMELTLEEKISQLKTQLQKAVENEEYELAAELRDKIREIENKK